MKILFERAKSALLKNVFILFEIIIFFPNKSHKRCSFVSSSFMKNGV